MNHWTSLPDFLHMGGYAAYVWGSVVVSALALSAEQLLLKRRMENIVRTLRQRARAERMDQGLA